MELRHLRYFLAVAEEGSFNRAALRLHVSQPSLGRQLSDLEMSLGQQLLERDARGVRLTPAGRSLVAHAQEVVRLADSSRSVVNTLDARERIILGIPPTVGRDWVLDLVLRCTSAAPEIALRLDEMLSVDLVAGVLSGSLDAAVTNRRPSDALHAVELHRDPFGLAIDPTRALGDRDVIETASLGGVRILAYAREVVPPEHDQAIREIDAASAGVHWEFARFVTHGLACAKGASADAVLCGAETARSQLPGWRWLPVHGLKSQMIFWLTWRRGAGSSVNRLVHLIQDG